MIENITQLNQIILEPITQLKSKRREGSEKVVFSSLTFYAKAKKQTKKTNRKTQEVINKFKRDK